jgi:excisionase family DNA binding protein
MTHDKGKGGDDVMTAMEAQAYLGITPVTLAKLLKNGTLPFERDPLDGRVKMVKRADVEKLAARSTRGKDAA